MNEGTGRQGEGDVKLNRDTVMGALLIASAILTFLYTRRRSMTRRMLALLGAATTVVIGAVLFFHVA